MFNMMKLVMFAGVIAAGCGGKKPATSGPTGGAGADPALNGCTTYKDMTKEAAYTVVWDETIASSDMRCLKSHAGTPISYTGNFTTHPMKAAGGDEPNPFTVVADNMSNPGTEQEAGVMSFDKPGVYGFKCDVHPTMTGAVVVLPLPPSP